MNLRCPYCGKSDCLVVFIDFYKFEENWAVCHKRNIKLSILRKFGAPIKNGCGKTFGILINKENIKKAA